VVSLSVETTKEITANIVGIARDMLSGCDEEGYQYTLKMISDHRR